MQQRNNIMVDQLCGTLICTILNRINTYVEAEAAWPKSLGEVVEAW